MSAVTDNRALFGKLATVAAIMFGFGYALVPLYEKICEVTGVNRVEQADALPANTQADTSRWLSVEFDANVGRGLPWSFKPVESSLNIHPGQLAQVTYEVANHSDRPIAGQAIPSYSPAYAARFFKKLECFCFTQQVLQPGEVRRMPVVFVIDPELPKDIGTVTLSYTFFVVEGATRDAAGV